MLRISNKLYGLQFRKFFYFHRSKPRTMFLRRWKARGSLGLLELYSAMCNMLYNTNKLLDMHRDILD